MPARLQSLQARLFPHGILDVVRQVLLFFTAYYGYRLVRGLVDDPQGATVAFDNARELIGIERGLHLFVEPSLQAWAVSKPAIADFASWMYINAQTSVTVGALVYLYLFHNPSFYWVRNMFMVAMALALVGYIVYPTAPPRFFPEWGFQDAVASFTGVDPNDVKVNALFNPYAAVPSMHCCNAILIGWSLSHMCKWRVARVAWALYPVLMVWVVVATANHWTIDAVLGGATAAVSFYAARWLARARPAAWAFSPAKATV